MRATELVVPALKIVNDRTEVPRAIDDTLADNAACGAIVLGGRTIRPFDVDVGAPELSSAEVSASEHSAGFITDMGA
jgi:2-keto-4-pentenoate hydratase